MKDTGTLTTIFREQGLRVTPQRQAIFRLLEGDDSHPTVESLFDRARRKRRLLLDGGDEFGSDLRTLLLGCLLVDAPGEARNLVIGPQPAH